MYVGVVTKNAIQILYKIIEILKEMLFNSDNYVVEQS